MYVHYVLHGLQLPSNKQTSPLPAALPMIATIAYLEMPIQFVCEHLHPPLISTSAATASFAEIYPTRGYD